MASGWAAVRKRTTYRTQRLPQLVCHNSREWEWASEGVLGFPSRSDLGLEGQWSPILLISGANCGQGKVSYTQKAAAASQGD